MTDQCYIFNIQFDISYRNLDMLSCMHLPELKVIIISRTMLTMFAYFVIKSALF